MNPLSNGHDDSLSLLRDIRDSLRQINRRLDQVVDSFVRRLPNRTESVPGLHELTDEGLKQRMVEARSTRDAYAVLEIRRVLVDRLDPALKATLDRELAEWFTDHFQYALRNGQAASVVGALERAVEEIGEIPEMAHLAESLPMVLRSVGLMPSAEDDRSVEES